MLIVRIRLRLLDLARNQQMMSSSCHLHAIFMRFSYALCQTRIRVIAGDAGRQSCITSDPEIWLDLKHWELRDCSPSKLQISPIPGLPASQLPTSKLPTRLSTGALSIAELQICRLKSSHPQSFHSLSSHPLSARAPNFQSSQFSERQSAQSRSSQRQRKPQISQPRRFRG